MRVNGFQCDTCTKVCDGNKLKEWLFVRDHETNSGYREQHFCTLKCLHEWTEKCLSDNTEYVSDEFGALIKVTPDEEEPEVNPSYRVSKEIADSVVRYMGKMGWNAQFKVEKDLNGDDYECLQAVKDGAFIRVDSEYLRGLDTNGVYRYIDECIDKAVGE
jgi:hypothetical protein